MSTQRSGSGGIAGQSPEFELDLANAQSVGSAPDSQSWDANAPSTQPSEVPYMVQGAGGPGQPNSGQRSIFGGGGPAFTQMPTYTPVTRAPEQPQAAPQAAPQPPYPPQTAERPAAPVHQPAPQAAPPMPQAPAQAYVQAPAAPAYQAPQPQPQAFDGGNPQFQPQPPRPMAAPEQAPAQSYSAPGYTNGAQPAPSQEIPDLSAADPGFPESIFPDFASTPASGADQNFGDASFPEPSFVEQAAADARFAEQGGDAAFPETNFAASPDLGHEAALHDASALGAAPQGHMPQPQAYAPQAPQNDPGRQLLAFDAVYDQPPEIALGGPQAPAPVPQEFFDADGSDADFVDESQVLPPPAARSKLASLKGRSAFMVGSALLGAIALGGALAFAYKQSGGGMGSEQPPIVQADNSPVKAAPADAGGKEFPHKNKLIYDRLTNGDVAESERLVPRQEDVAVPALPPATATAGLPTPVASTDLGTTQSIAAGEEGADGGPRKVKTLVVRPDGSVETPPPVAAAAEAAQTAAAAPADAAAAAPQASVMPVPAAPITPPEAAPAAPQQVAALAPKPAPTAPAANTKYVVQVGAKKNQTEALATFADIQQKYPTLLGDYRPIVQKANLGAKGTWYRLRIGPIDDKAEAYKLCGQLKSQGLPDCLVMTQ